MEAHETELETALREIYEEVGIKPFSLDGSGACCVMVVEALFLKAAVLTHPQDGILSIMSMA